MDTQLLTLSKIFTERLFRIPDYQRGYAWTEKQLKDFWNDIQQLEKDRNHYTGVLTLENVPDKIFQQWEDDYWIIKSKSYEPYYIVDGQQRLTTAIILIDVILESLPIGEKLNFTDKVDVQRKFIYDSKDDGISRSYIFGYEKDNPSYEYLKTKIFCEKSSTSISHETVYTNNLFQAKQFFSKRVSELSIKELEVLYRKVTQQLLFNIFTITEDVDVCVAFETMNNRGKPLSYLELLKNRLIYLSLKFSAPDYERNKLRRAINDCWKSIYHNLGRNKEKPLDDDNFLLTHYLIYYGRSNISVSQIENKTGFGRLYRADYASDLLEKRFIPKNVSLEATDDVRISLKDIYRYVSSLQESVETWYKMYNPFNSDFSKETQIWLDKINRLSKDFFHPLILAYLQKISSESKRIVFLQVVERYIFLDMIFGLRFYNEYDLFETEMDSKLIQFATDLANDKISGEKIIKILNENINFTIKETHCIKEIQSRFKANGYYEWPGIRYFLFEYNLYLQNHSKTERPKIFWPEFTEQKSDFISVEHIYPKQARHEYWTTRFNDLTHKQRMIIRNSLGNLLPLSKPKNSSLSNLPFPKKVDGKKETVIGYRFGSYAENEVSRSRDWTPAEILERGMKMLNFMEKRWCIPLGDERKKKSMLGLDFLK